MISKPKVAPDYVDELVHTHSEVSGRPDQEPDYCQGEAEEPSKSF